MDLKTENTPAVPETQEDLDGIPVDVAARLTPEEIELVKEVSKKLDLLWEKNPELQARLAKSISQACEDGLM